MPPEICHPTLARGHLPAILVAPEKYATETFATRDFCHPNIVPPSTFASGDSCDPNQIFST